MAAPLVSIGMPVFNGAHFLQGAIESVLAQDFRDFELIIADNASTDETAEICKSYAAKDTRLKYVRHPKNIGAAKNYNYVFYCSSGTYFQWMAHDDLLGPRFLSACLDGFKMHSGTPMVVYPNFQLIDQDSRVIERVARSVHTVAASPGKRLSEALDSFGAMVEVYGLFRKDALAQTRLIRSFVSSDFVFVAECAMIGPIIRLDGEPQFLRRLHQKSSWVANKSNEERLNWFDPDATSTHSLSARKYSYEYFRRVGSYEYIKAIFSVGGLTLPERLGALAVVFRRIVRKRTGRWRRALVDALG